MVDSVVVKICPVCAWHYEVGKNDVVCPVCGCDHLMTEEEAVALLRDLGEWEDD